MGGESPPILKGNNMNDPRFSGINKTVLDLIGVLGEVLEYGYIPKNHDMYSYVQDCITQAQRDLNYYNNPIIIKPA
jgi:hypothetical protein